MGARRQSADTVSPSLRPLQEAAAVLLLVACTGGQRSGMSSSRLFPVYDRYVTGKTARVGMLAVSSRDGVWGGGGGGGGGEREGRIVGGGQRGGSVVVMVVGGC